MINVGLTLLTQVLAICLVGDAAIMALGGRPRLTTGLMKSAANLVCDTIGAVLFTIAKGGSNLSMSMLSNLPNKIAPVAIAAGCAYFLMPTLSLLAVSALTLPIIATGAAIAIYGPKGAITKTWNYITNNNQNNSPPVNTANNAQTAQNGVNTPQVNNNPRWAARIDQERNAPQRKLAPSNGV
ncbi:hypothetical protein NOVO_06685 [Rickettsiales bacterium Ac37b]|nr:hypothetical protein NOVO_06685 [Rickettsiales bacterium Ac37b]